jgi:hypothetical protein
MFFIAKKGYIFAIQNNSFMKKVIVLSGDIVAYTSLSNIEKTTLEKSVKALIKDLQEKHGVYGRLIKGDYIEIAIDKPENALEIVLLIKCLIKSIDLDQASVRNKFFRNYGIRIAMGYGDLSRFNKKKGIIDGEAIYLSGRKISDERTTHDKERIVIKNTLFFVSNDDLLNQNINAQLGLIEVLINNATAKQCKILYQRLMGFSELEISESIGIKQPTVNKQLSSVGWNAIERALKYFKILFKNNL